MQNTVRVIDAILINNPSAVSGKLAALGLIDEGQTLTPDELKNILYDVTTRLNDDEGNEFVVAALDVPIDLEGESAEALVDYQIEHGNRLSIQSELSTYLAPPERNSKRSPIGFSRLANLSGLECLMGAFLIVLIIALLKKI